MRFWKLDLYFAGTVGSGRKKASFILHFKKVVIINVA